MSAKPAGTEKRIQRNPAIMAGKPVIKGTRVPVARVLQHLADNPNFDDLFQAFPHLKLADVQACLAYAADLMQQDLQEDWKAQGSVEQGDSPNV